MGLNVAVFVRPATDSKATGEATKASDIRSVLGYDPQTCGGSEGSITMLRALRKVLRPSSKDSLAKAFTSLGWTGFWIQLVIGVIPVFFAIYAMILGRNAGAGTRGGSLLVEYLAIAGLIVLGFTTVWSYRYTRLGEQIADPARRPSEFAVQRVAWIGVASSAIGILLSMLVMLFEVVQLLLYFLRAPRVGVPVIQTNTSGQESWDIRGRHDEFAGSKFYALRRTHRLDT